jgi:hypothetical protein
LVEIPTIWFARTPTIDKVSLLDFMSFQFFWCTYSVLFCTCVHEPLPIELWVSMPCPECFFFLHFVGILGLGCSFGFTLVSNGWRWWCAIGWVHWWY